MNKSENNDFKILIDALKYTSNIIVDLTNKLNEQENKINKIENSINIIKKEYIELNSKNILTTHNNTINLNTNTNSLAEKQILKNIKNKENDTECEQIATYLLSKNNDSNDYDKINDKLKNNIFQDKNKINKLINSIVKKKNSLNEIIENNKEKSLLTEYNFNEIDYEQKDNFSEEKEKSIVQKFDNSNTNINTNANTNTNVNTNTNENLKNIRKKSNFARRF